MSRVDEIDGNLSIINLKPVLYNIDAHTKFGKNPFEFTRYCPEAKIRVDVYTTDGRTDGQTDRRTLSCGGV